MLATSETTADWVMFCDFDDTFANVYALMDIPHPIHPLRYGGQQIRIRARHL